MAPSVSDISSTATAIIDIGSNSVRLVIYEGLSRSPVPLFNESVLCGLGSHIATTGSLDDSATTRAFTALRRFRLLCEQNSATIHPFATAAVRDADNGSEFVTLAQQILQSDIQVLSGREEAYYAALGIVCGFQSPRGLAADMGGGSVEFTLIDGDPTGEGMTLPLGGLRLLDEYGDNLPAAQQQVDDQIGSQDFFTKAKKASGGTFYAVGGTWRSLAALHMAQIDYPFRIMHHYELSGSVVKSLCRDILDSLPKDLDNLDSVSSSRRSLLPYGAMVMDRILTSMNPSKVIFSAFGVREGYLYSLFPESTKQEDPLLVSAMGLCRRYSRSPDHSHELDLWTTESFKVFGIPSDTSQDRLRRISCLVCDISWRSSPDYRAGQSLNFLLHANFVGLDHSERSSIALSSYHRHKGSKSGSTRLSEIAGSDQTFRAKLLGGLFRLAFLFSSGRSGIIPHLSFTQSANSDLFLNVPSDLSNFAGESVHRRLKDLGKLLDRNITLQMVTSHP